MKQLFPEGLLIAVEGIDGAGKTSVAALLAQYCGERGIACVLSKEPTSLKWGRELRRSASTGRLSLEDELELFRKDRAMHMAGTIPPAMQQGHVVIVDRYYCLPGRTRGRPRRHHNRARILRPPAGLLPAPRCARGPRPRAHPPPRRSAQRFRKKDSLEKARAIFLELAARSPGHSFTVDAGNTARDVSRACIAKFQALAEAKLGPDSEAMAVFLGTAD